MTSYQVAPILSWVPLDLEKPNKKLLINSGTYNQFVRLTGGQTDERHSDEGLASETSVSDPPDLHGVQLSLHIPICSIYTDAVLLVHRLTSR